MRATYKTFTVTVVFDANDSKNYYHIDTVKKPILQIVRDKEYIIDQSDASNNGHPMYFAWNKDGLHEVADNYVIGKRYEHGFAYYLDNVRVTPDVYTNTTTFDAATTRKIIWLIPTDCPVKIYPVCKVHSGMYDTSYWTCDETNLAIQQIIDRIDSQAATASVTEVSNLAKTLNNVENTKSDTNYWVNGYKDETGDAGPEVAYNDRSAEFGLWGGRHQGHNHCGGGTQVYDSMLESPQIRKYMGFHCHDGADGNYHNGWSDHNSNYYGGNVCYLDTACHTRGGHCWSGGTDSISELGHTNIRLSEGGEHGYYNDVQKVFRQQESVGVDSWEVRDNRYYVCTNGEQVLLKDRFYTGMEGSSVPVSSKVYPTGGYGSSSSFNRKRKEAVFLQRSSLNRNNRFGTDTGHTDSDIYFHGFHNTGQEELGSAGSSKYRLRYYYNVPQIDGNTNLSLVLNDSDSKTYFSEWLMGGHWQGNYKCVLTDNGDVIGVHSGYNMGYNAARFVRTTDGRAIRYHHLGTQYCSSCYTAPHDTNMRGAGVKVIMSRNKRNACLFGSYYYYGSGSCGWVIGRDNNIANGELIYNTETYYGVHICPFRDGDFYFHLVHDWNDWNSYHHGATSVIHQDGRGNFRRYSVGQTMDSQGHSTNFICAVPFHHDSLNY